MEKKCLVIMPTGDPEGYPQGHFNRVYEYIIVPACKQADVVPLKVEEETGAGGSAWDIAKNLVDSDIAICDFSSQYSNVLYGFGIRQALALPVVLIKDAKTRSVIDIQEFDGIEYDDSLRIDIVQRAIGTLCDALKNTLMKKVDKSPTLTRLGIGPGQSTEPRRVEFEVLTDQTVSTAQPESHVPMISPVPDFVGAPLTQHDIDKLKVGDAFFHMVHGKGEIKSIKNMAAGRMATVQFESGSKTLIVGATTYFRKITS